MTADQKILWQRIESAPLISVEEEELFRRKLACQNGWSSRFTERCLNEYRKFVFLASVLPHAVSPPDAVDQVWHLHLTYTRQYWKVYCAEVLGKPLHHTPSSGRQDAQKFDAWYTETLKSYRSLFGAAPADIWPEPPEKAARDKTLHRRVDTNRHWIVPKPPWLFSLFQVAPLAFLSLVLAGCATLDKELSDLNVSGPVFLCLYLALLGVSLLICRWARSSISGIRFQPGSPPPNLALYEIAYLAGGARRVLQAIFVRLHETGHATLNDRGKVIGNGVPDRLLDPAEKQASECLRVGEKTWDQLRETIHPRLTEIHERLEEMGLLVNGIEKGKMRSVCGLAMGSTLVIGFLRLWHGFQNGKPVGILLFLMAAALVLMLWLMQGPFRTRQGDEALANLQHRFNEDREKIPGQVAALDGAVLATAVALLGTSAVKGTPLERLESKLGPEGGGGCGGGGCGSSCAGGGCGGGCGGCGG